MTASPMRADILVIGGGIVGLTAALAIAEAGTDVLVVDWGRNAGSTANAGSLHVQMQSRILRHFPELEPNIEASLPLYVEAVREWERLDQAHGGFELSRDGGLMVAETEGQLAFLHSKADREHRRGLDVDVLERAALERIAGYLGPHILGAELCREEGKLNPLVANARLHDAAIAAGARFANDRIVGIEGTGPSVRVDGEMRYLADRVIIAAAWGTGGLVEGLGVHIPTVAEPLHMNITEPAAYALRHLVQHAERAITLKQFTSGQIVIGGGWPADQAAEPLPPTVRHDSLTGNIALAAGLVPGLRPLRVLRTWAGLNTTTDGGCVLGALPREERVIVAVPGDAGYTLGPLCGRAAAALVLGTVPPMDLAPFAPSRFSR